METNFDIVEAANGFKVDGENFPITTVVTKTVGSTVGNDFPLFHDAMTWACKQVTKGRGKVRLLLDDGTHILGEPDEFDQNEWLYYSVTSHIGIEGASGDKTLCTITMSPTDDGDQWPTVVGINSGGFLSASYVTFDMGAGLYPYPENVSLGYANEACTMYSCTFEDMAVTFWGNNGNVTINTCLINNCVTGVQGHAVGMNCLIATTTISNCTTGISISPGNWSSNNVIRLKAVTFTTNTANTDVTINEIQYDGSVIVNGTSALSFKA